MPDKEALKVAVETSGSWLGWWQWLVGSAAAICSGGWFHLTGRIGKLESTLVSAAQFKDHVDSEETQFAALDAKHDLIMEKVSKIGEDVAFIKGRIK